MSKLCHTTRERTQNNQEKIFSNPNFPIQNRTPDGWYILQSSKYEEWKEQERLVCLFKACLNI